MRVKLNKKGFTLIELLAVIVIMGILMMVAIPAMSKVIENSRKDTFIETAQTYVNSVNTLWKSDSLYCGSAGYSPSSLPAGNYYILVDSTDTDLVERGGKSSWGNRDVKGYVRVNIDVDSEGKRKETFYVALSDGIHGVKEISEDPMKLKRRDVILDLTKDDKYFTKNTSTTCVTDGYGTDGTNSVEMLKGNISNPKVGDMFGIGDQQFHVIKSTNDTITGLGKYNLFAGYEYESTKLLKDYSTLYKDDPYYMMQKEGMRAQCDLTFIRKGTTKYSTFYSDYQGSIAQEFMNNYKTKLEKKNVNILEARLIEKSEIDEIAKDEKNKEWLFYTSYYTQTKIDDRNVWEVQILDRPKLRSTSCNVLNWTGVRPVITISKEEFYK